VNALLRSWERLPVIVRAAVAGAVVVSAGTLPQSILTRLNFQFAPGIPWSVPVMALYLYVYWRLVSGRGWPRAAADWRRSSLRAVPLPGHV